VTPVYILIALAAALIAAGVVIYNRLVSKDQMAKNGWADIDVQLKRRTDLIPAIVTTVKGYAAHEQALFTEVVERRNAAMTAGDDPGARGEAESALSRPVARILAVAEAYPDLKASENFLELQRELSETEGKIEMARRFYNGAVRELNTAVESFPANPLAGLFGFGTRDYFEIETADRQLPEVRI
jgi:LemA protein